MTDARLSLSRLLDPRSVAVVGVSERRRMSTVAVGHLLNAPVDLHLVTPNNPSAFGRPTVPSLAAIGAPVDAVLSLVGAEASLQVVEEAGALGCGGVVVIASGFAEEGEKGRELQARLQRAAAEAGVAVIGPNCTGFANVSSGVSLFTGMPVPVGAGGVSIVSQSGYLMRSAMVAARERNLGVRLAISTGNEAVIGLADHLDFLIEDPSTRLICVVLETVRDRVAFFEAVDRGRTAGKPILVLKLGTTERGRELLRSHTGAITTESWVYEIGLKQAGVLLAGDVDDLVDQAQLLAQIRPDRWRSARRVAVLASSGGAATLASDIMAGQGVELPPLDHLLDRIRETVPGAPYANPLDLTGFAVEPPDLVEGLLQVFAESPDVDTVAVCWWTGEEDEERAEMLLAPLRDVGARTDAVMVMSTVEQARIGGWSTGNGRDVVSFGRGLRSTARALAAMSDYVEFQPSSPPRAGLPAPSLPPLPRPRSVASAVGPIVSFADANRLLAEHGVPVAPYRVVEGLDAVDDVAVTLAGLGDSLVVKLADVPHRSDLGAVRLGVTPESARAAIASLAALADRMDVPGRVAIQPMVPGAGEVFLGARNHTDLGSVLVVGLGGIFVELTRTVVGRLLPLADGDIDAMLDELGGASVFKGLRGQAAWNRDALAGAIRGLAGLVARAPWLESIDINPMICDEHGCTAVDALLVLTAEADPAGG
jgi:acetate---CoA ligase (ADP-forming)